MQKKNIFNKIQLALWNSKGESYVDTGVKMLIAIVIGALLLTGIYAITRDVVLENVETQISDFFDQTPTLDGAGGGSGNGGSGGQGGQGGSGNTYAANFADNSWDDIALACQNNEVPDTWNVGDTKPMTINGNEVDIMIIGKNHDEYTDGGIAPLTFMTKQIVEQRAINSTNTNAGGWDGSEMYAYLNGDLLNSLECKDSIKAVKKVTNIGGKDAGGTAITIEESADKLFLMSKIEVEATDVETVTGIYVQEGNSYEYFTNYDSRKLANLSGTNSDWWLRSPSNDNDSCFEGVNSSGMYDFYCGAKYARGVIFGFCF